jgi:hypothetical protein
VLYIIHILTGAFLRSITFLFLFGGAGCVVALAMTFWEDLKTVTGSLG